MKLTKQKKRNSFLIIIFLFCLNTSFAQEKSDDVEQKSILGIFSFVSTLNKQINDFFDNEKLLRLQREVGYFRSDLQSYLKYREQIISKMGLSDINQNNYPKFNSKTKQLVSTEDLDILVIKLNKMNSQFEKIHEITGVSETKQHYLISNLIVKHSNRKTSYTIPQLIKFNTRIPVIKKTEDIKLDAQILTQSLVENQKKWNELLEETFRLEKTIEAKISKK